MTESASFTDFGTSVSEDGTKVVFEYNGSSLEIAPEDLPHSATMLLQASTDISRSRGATVWQTIIDTTSVQVRQDEHPDTLLVEVVLQPGSSPLIFRCKRSDLAKR